jgi:CheY-like chemotaxis protein
MDHTPEHRSVANVVGLTFSDVSMPSMNGFELLKRVHQRPLPLSVDEQLPSYADITWLGMLVAHPRLFGH